VYDVVKEEDHMHFDEYQKAAIKTDTYTFEERGLSHHSFFEKLLGLMGETGEIAEKFKKIYRDNNGEMTDEQLSLMKKEFGDVIWYVAVLADYLGLSFDEVATHNIEKLRDRQKRGKIQGSGDTR
jgi:NTP pyrophosphatase (non-canonical NTP hydrolase)